MALPETTPIRALATLKNRLVPSPHDYAYKVGEKLYNAALQEDSSFGYSGSGASWQTSSGKEITAYFLYVQGDSGIQKVVSDVEKVLESMDKVTVKNVEPEREGNGIDELYMPACIEGTIRERARRATLHFDGRVRDAIRGAPFSFQLQFQTEENTQMLDVYVCNTIETARAMFKEFMKGNHLLYSVMRAIQ